MANFLCLQEYLWTRDDTWTPVQYIPKPARPRIVGYDFELLWNYLTRQGYEPMIMASDPDSVITTQLWSWIILDLQYNSAEHTAAC